ncbi:hypothetical protein M0R45_015739 [Rubus argutus]|uniref:Uncharacterized protein n=1 Tax=Rubus argutus TaxID=59490 RepID=A0AAW1XSX8_RUBAR
MKSRSVARIQSPIKFLWTPTCNSITKLPSSPCFPFMEIPNQLHRVLSNLLCPRPHRLTTVVLNHASAAKPPPCPYQTGIQKPGAALPLPRRTYPQQKRKRQNRKRRKTHHHREHPHQTPINSSRP